MQPHWFEELQTHVAPVPHWSVEPIGHVFVQKCVIGSPSDEHNRASEFVLQSDRLAQNFPMPSSLP